MSQVPDTPEHAQAASLTPTVVAQPTGERSETGPQPELAPFREWPARPVAPADEVTTGELADVLAEIIAAEGPMVAELAYRRYMRASGGQRLGGVLKSAFNKAASHLVRRGRVRQLVDGLPGQMTKTLYLPKTPPVVVRERGARELREVPRSEVQAVLRINGLADELTEDIMRLTLEAYGRSALTRASRDLLRDCANYTWSEP